MIMVFLTCLSHSFCVSLTIWYVFPIMAINMLTRSSVTRIMYTTKITWTNRVKLKYITSAKYQCICISHCVCESNHDNIYCLNNMLLNIGDLEIQKLLAAYGLINNLLTTSIDMNNYMNVGSKISFYYHHHVL